MIEANQHSERLEALAELSRRHPGWRFGRLVADWADQNVWDAKDADLLRVARLHLEQFNAPVPDEVNA